MVCRLSFIGFYYLTPLSLAQVVASKPSRAIVTRLNEKQTTSSLDDGNRSTEKNVSSFENGNIFFR